MAVLLKRRRKKPDLSAAVASIAKAIVLAIPAVAAGDPVSRLKAGSGAINQIIDAAIALRKDTTSSLPFAAWDVVRSGFSVGLLYFFSEVNLERAPVGPELETLVSDLIRRSDILVDQNEYVINIESFTSPLLIPPMRDAASRIPSELKLFGSKQDPSELRKLFEDAMLKGLKFVRDEKPDLFKSVESALAGPYTVATEKVNSLAFHRAFLVRAFTQTPIFGQEHTGITVSNLYIRQRCLWHVKENKQEKKSERSVSGSIADAKALQTSPRNKKVTRLHLGDLHEVVHDWLAARQANDAVRVIAGGPGSGKSTFAKAVSIEIIDSGQYDVLFIPLQDIDSVGSFETRIGTLYRNRSDLGFDRVESPLNWLARTQYDGTSPPRPLLLICDGLDEIAPPESTEAANVTTDFIQSLNTWIGSRNSAGCYAKAIVLGRNISAKEAFGKLGIDDLALLNVGGLMPINETTDWKKKEKSELVSDLKALRAIDQRLIYWKLWASCIGVDPHDVPEPIRLKSQGVGSLQSLTAEPLLMYLLLWTGYIGDKWREAADNKNLIYQEIFTRIFQRDWGKSAIDLRTAASSDLGGHTGTHDMDFEEFIILQEALGIASWQSGGRSVSKSSFDKLLKYHVSEDMLDDLKQGPGLSLKSVALQGYTRSSEEEAGYEFVHKSLSDYLIGRGLVRTMEKGLHHLQGRTNDERCRRAAIDVAQVAHSGALSIEIAQFFKDELRLRYQDRKEIGDILQSRFAPLCNWILKHLFPVHELDGFEKDTSYIILEQAERRSMDAFWTLGQCLLLQYYRTDGFGAADMDGGWKSGPFKLEWPTTTSFHTMFTRLSERNHCAETGRLCTFYRLDLSGQMFTDTSMGSVVFIADAGLIRPSVWFPLKAAGSMFYRAAFYSTNLLSCDLSMCEFRDCTLSGSELSHGTLNQSTFEECQFIATNAANSEFKNCTFNNCDMQRVNFSDCDFVQARFENIRFGGYLPPERGKVFPRTTTLNGANFHRATLSGIDFNQSECVSVGFKEAILEKCRFYRANIKSADFERADMRGAVISRSQARRVDLRDRLVEELVVATKEVIESFQEGTLSLDLRFEEDSEPVASQD